MVGTKVKGRSKVRKHDLNPGPADDSPSVYFYVFGFPIHALLGLASDDFDPTHITLTV